MKTVFVSGNADLSKNDFVKYYKDKIAFYASKGYNFIVGDKVGLDSYFQIFYIKMNYDLSKVKVFHKGDRPKNFFSDKFFAVGGFVSDLEASVAMTFCSDIDLAYVYDKREKSEVSLNILRRHTMNFDYLKYSKDKNRNKEFWDIINYKEDEK